MFEAVVGRGITGDIAIDQLSLSPGACGISPAMAFPPGMTTLAATTAKSTSPPHVTSSMLHLIMILIISRN